MAASYYDKKKLDELAKTEMKEAKKEHGDKIKFTGWELAVSNNGTSLHVKFQLTPTVGSMRTVAL